MNATIKWMIEKAQNTETLSDGTITYFFQGNIPARMKTEIKKAATSERGTNGQTVYNASGDTWGWSAKFGAHMSDQYSVKFSFNDYTVPAAQ